MNESHITPELLQKYLDATCTEQEKATVEQWYASLQGTSHYLDSLPDKDKNRLQAETFRRVQQDLAPAPIPEDSTAGRGTYWRGCMSVAASLVVVAGSWLFYNLNSGSSGVPLAHTPAKQAVPASVDPIRFVNTEPRMAMHLLPDGSTVWLHTGATITYPVNFQSDYRQVTFEGEGFFDVKSDRKRPFVIQSGDMKVEVLGTRFNIKAPPKEMIYEVSVVSGRVAVSAPDQAASAQKVILAPQQQALFEIQNKRLTSNTIPPEAKKEIYEPITVQFEGTPLDRVTEQLSRRFDMRLHLVNPAMKSCRLTADFEQQTLPAILEMLCATLDATYTMSGKTILIEGEPCEF